MGIQRRWVIFLCQQCSQEYKVIKHIVWFTLKEEAEGATAAENAVEMVRMLRGLVGRISSLKQLEVSSEVLDTSTEEVGVVLQSVHDDVEGLHTYAVHPEHQKCVAFIKKVIASRKVIDYVV